MSKLAKCAKRKFPTSLVNSIMQYSNLSPNIPSLKWGHQNEERAKIRYRNEMDKHHSNFSICSTELLVSIKYPLLGATPDGLISCSCCDTGLLEIKCPYSYRHVNPSDFENASFYLHTESDSTKYWILVMIITIRYRGKCQYGRRTIVTLYIGPMKAMLLPELSMMWIFLKILLANVSIY